MWGGRRPTDGERNEQHRITLKHPRDLGPETNVLGLGAFWGKRPPETAEVELCVEVQGEMREGLVS